MARKDFLTPPYPGEDVTCRTLRTPSDKEVLGVFNSALLTLTEAWRWEQVNLTDMTVEEAVAMCEEILAEFWMSSECDTCLQPTGVPFLRVNPDGSVEQLIEGTWQEPTGDYTPVPPPVREGGTEQDQICLAAKNAVNALHILYEDLADSYATGLSQAEAFSKFLLAVAAIIAAWLALWVAAIVAVVGIIFSIVYETLEFVTADLWDSNFTEALTCIFIDCASNTAGVVTFDYNCLVSKLAANTDPLGDLTAAQLRLFGQLLYIFQFIGADGINSAGGTTAITDDDCSFCTNEWCYTWDFELTSGTAEGWAARQGGETYVGGQGWKGFNLSADSYTNSIILNFSPPADLLSIEWEGEAELDASGGARGIWVNGVFAASIGTGSGAVSGGWTAGGTVSSIFANIDRNASPTGQTYHKRVTLRGTGDNPFGEDNCE